MTLFEINDAIREVIERGLSVDEETGEVLFTAEDLETLQIDLQTKVENIACYIKNLQSDIEALKNEEAAFAKRRKIKENTCKRLGNMLANFMVLQDVKKIETPQALVKYNKSEAVEIENPELLPIEFIEFNVVETSKPNKIAIKNAIKQGVDVTGARLIQRNNVVIK